MIVSSNQIKLPYKFFTVESGSMKPSLNVGDLILIKEEPKYSPGDIDTFATPIENKGLQIVTHRIISKEKIAERWMYTTKGDFNSVRDIKPVEEGQIVGKYLLKIPLIGLLISFMRTVLGFTIILVIPSTIIIYEEVLNIAKVIREQKEKTTLSK